MEMYVKIPEKSTSEVYKTPTWLINQLANYNKLKHDYRLEKEEGYYKTKKFTMSLRMGDEVWMGTGTTKKEAKRNAAEIALKNTSLLPVPDTKSKKLSVVNQNALTSTVRLNGMAMALGKQVVYTVIAKKYGPKPLNTNIHLNTQQQLLGSAYVSQDVRQHNNPNHFANVMGVIPQPWQINAANSINTVKSMHNSPNYKYYEGPCRFTVCVTVGEDKFFGEGPTQQAARHDAAGHAIVFLQNQPVTPKPIAPQNGNQSAYRKSFVSILYEESLPRNMNVEFKLVDERGPPHLKRYTLEVTVGYFIDGTLDKQKPYYQATASESCKKAAKQSAAALVLKKMSDLPARVKGKRQGDKKSGEMIEASDKTPPHMHPVSRLLQVSQAQKIEEPKYLLIEQDQETTNFENRYAIQCTLQDKTITAFGKTKKDAKRNAATEMLNCIGYLPNLSRVIPNLDMIPQKTSMKQNAENQDHNPGAKHCQVQFSDKKITNQRSQAHFVPVSFK